MQRAEVLVHARRGEADLVVVGVARRVDLAAVFADGSWCGSRTAASYVQRTDCPAATVTVSGDQRVAPSASTAATVAAGSAVTADTPAG